MFWPINVPDRVRARFSQRLEVLAHVVFLLFVLLCIVPIWPIRALDLPWLLHLGKQILQLAGLVLMGIAMLELARQLAPWRRHLQARRALILAVAKVVSIGFFLMIPLQIGSIWMALAYGLMFRLAGLRA